MRLSDFKVLTFDCYGTLIDWESGMVEALKSLTERVASAPTRNADPGGTCAPRIGPAGPDAGSALQGPARHRVQAASRTMGRPR